MNGKGQVTLFVILGLVLLLIVALSLLLLSSTQPEQSGRINAQEILTFVEACIHAEAKSALQTIGHQGGLYDLSGRTANKEQPWRGDAFMSGPQMVPYWYRMDACTQNPGCIVFDPPPLCRVGECYIDGQYPDAGRSMQVELETALEEIIPECIADYSTNNAFELVSAGTPEVRVTFTADDTLVDVTWPLIFTSTESNERVTLEEFSAQLDVDMEETYRLARELLELEYKTQFIEENFLHFLSVYQGDPPLLPPFSDAEFFGSQKIWVRTEVEEQLEQEILPYLSFMQVPNAYEGYRPFIVTEEVDEEYRDYVRGLFAYSELFLGDSVYPEHGVSFLYPFSNIYLNINDEEVLKGQSLDSGNFFTKIAGVFIKRYEHRYDVAWPMLVVVEDTDAFGGEGYTLTFGIEANVANNFPMTPGRSIITVDQRTVEHIDQGEPQHHAEGTATLYVSDRRTGLPLSGASVTYECGWSYRAVHQTNDEGVWTGTLPYCPVGGVLRAEVPLEYYPEAVSYNNDGLGGSHAVALWPYTTKQVIVYKLSAQQLEAGCVDATLCRSELSWDQPISYTVAVDSEGFTQEDCEDCVNQTVSAEQSQYALVMINKVSDGLVNEPVPLQSTLTFGKEGEHIVFNQQQEIENYLSQFNLTPEEESDVRETVEGTLAFETTLTTTQEVSLIPGQYALEGLLFFDGIINIPSEKRGGGLLEPSYTLPAIELPSWLQGGVDFTQQPVTFSEAEVYGENTLVVHVLEQPLPTSWTDLEHYQAIEDSQLPYLTYLIPRFE